VNIRERAITIVDVGARWGVESRWASLAPDLRIYGFDPDPEECARLNKEAEARGDTTTVYVPAALGAANGPATLHVTEEPACSSLYPPLASLASGIPELACITEKALAAINVTTLDEWCRANGVDRVDAIKLDVQGAELDVLRGATSTLTEVQLLEIEVEFNPIYKSQPLFGDVDAFLRDQGFMLWTLDNLVHYSAGDGAGGVDTVRRSYYDSAPFDAPGRGGQLYWAHAYYARVELCPAQPALPSPEQATRAAALAGAAGLPDLAASISARPTRTPHASAPPTPAS
jgi:FkbM family methyltransferase